MKKILGVAIGMVLLGAAIVWATGEGNMEGAETKVMGFPGSHGSLWQLKGAQPYLIGGYGDNFSHNGEKVKPVTGDAKVLLDAEQDMGIMIATINGTINPEKGKIYTGQIKLVYKVLPKKGPSFMEGGVADFVYLHGDTGQGPPVMPKTRTFIGAWSPVDVYVDEKLVYKNLHGHMMYTEKVRDTVTQAIYADASRKTFYSPKNPKEGYIVNPDGRELHFVAHTAEKDPNNFPPHTVWIHLNFEEAGEIK